MTPQHELYGAYSIVLEWDPVGRIYVVNAPELPGCHSHGRTRAEAAKQAEDAIAIWIEAARAWGRPVPSPQVWTDAEEDAPSTTTTGMRALTPSMQPWER